MAAIGRSIVLWFVIGALLASAGWLAVQAWHRPPPAEGPVMRTYAVRPELAIEIQSAVDVAVKPYNASVTRSGQLMVTAPPAYQRGVEELLKEVAAHNPATPPSIRIEAWFVRASPGPHVDSPTLEEIEPALHAIEQSKGPMRFDLLEELSMLARVVGLLAGPRGSGADLCGRSDRVGRFMAASSSARIGCQWSPARRKAQRRHNCAPPGRPTGRRTGFRRSECAGLQSRQP